MQQHQQCIKSCDDEIVALQSQLDSLDKQIVDTHELLQVAKRKRDVERRRVRHPFFVLFESVYPLQDLEPIIELCSDYAGIDYCVKCEILYGKNLGCFGWHCVPRIIKSVEIDWRKLKDARIGDKDFHHKVFMSSAIQNVWTLICLFIQQEKYVFTSWSHSKDTFCSPTIFVQLSISAQFGNHETKGNCYFDSLHIKLRYMNVLQKVRIFSCVAKPQSLAQPKKIRTSCSKRYRISVS